MCRLALSLHLTPVIGRDMAQRLTPLKPLSVTLEVFLVRNCGKAENKHAVSRRTIFFLLERPHRENDLLVLLQQKNKMSFQKEEEIF